MRWFCIFLLFLTSLFAEVCVEKRPFIERFETYAKRAMKDWCVPGMTLAVIKNGGLVFAKGYGKSHLSSSAPVTPRTEFMLGAISKTLTANLMAIKIDQSDLTWDSAVCRHLKDFCLYDEWVTKNFFLNDLFSQKTGFAKKIGDCQALLGMEVEQILKNLRHIKPQTSFRLQFATQNLFPTLGAKILETKEEKSFDTLLKEALLDPLEMKNTRSSYSSYLKQDKRAGFYKWHKGEIYNQPEQICYHYNELVLAPSLGISSNALDLANFLKLNLSKGTFNQTEILTRPAYAKLVLPDSYIKRVGGRETFATLGWIYTDYTPHPYLWQVGETLGSKALISFMPEENIGIVILTNLSNTKLPEALLWKFYDLYFGKKSPDYSAHLLSQEMKKKPDTLETITPEPLSALQNYTGHYTNEQYGDAYVEKNQDFLEITLGPKKMKMRLYPYDVDTFILDWPYISDNTLIYFKMNPDMNIEKMTLELFDGAVFEKVTVDPYTSFGYL